MQYHSSTGDGSLSVFLAELVQRHLESVLAANGLASLPEKTTSGQPLEAPGGGGDDVQLEEPGSKGDEGSLSAVLAAPQPELPSEKKQMGEEAQALVLQCEEWVRSLAWKFVRSSGGRVDVDEMYSIGMVAVCEAVSLACGALVRDPVAYLHVTARHAMVHEWQRIHECSTASLDASLSERSSLTLYDVLSAPASLVPASVEREGDVHGALGRLLSARQRAVLRWRYGLSEYGKASMKETARALGTTVKAVDGLTLRGLHNLARDARLCEVMGVEVVK